MSGLRHYLADHEAMPLTPQHGVALIIVLWMLALLTVIANSMMFSLQSEIQVAGNQLAAARVEAAADAAVYKAIRELTRPITDTQRWQGNGLTHDWSFGDVAMRVTILDEAGKIDINTAPENLLSSMFRSLGGDEGMANSLADTIADWRDPDDLRRLHGAEKEDYIAAGKDFVPRNVNFEAIDELRLVLGMSEELYWRVVPLVTVHSGQTGVASAVASRAVLLALPDATVDQVDAYVARRDSLLAQGLPVPAATFAQTSATQPIGNAFSIQVDAIFGDNTRFLREAVVFTAALNPKMPVVILAWRTLRGNRDNSSPNLANHAQRHNDI
jgi:general secretion pathway protein K